MVISISSPNAEIQSDGESLRARLCAGTATFAFALALFAPSAHAQQAAPVVMASADAAAPAAAVDEPAVDEAVDDAASEGDPIVVTGTRIVRDGYDAPTPVSVISTKEINAEAPANITDFVNTLPAVRGSTTASSSNGSLSNGAAGVSALNLRNLGAVRTLILFDGQRSVASTTTGLVDINTFPQALIERVEVVTGGASSAYGSDAVSGVVNFVLNKTFKGLKAEVIHGVTTYGDGANYKGSLTYGGSFIDDRLHVLLSGEYFKQTGIQSIDRDWNETGYFTVNNPAYSATACTDASATTICYPEYLITAGAGTGTFTPGGLVTSGALRGTYFGTIDPATGKATVNQLAFGATSGQWMVGGDYDITSAGHRSSATLLPSEKRISGFGRVSFEFAPSFNVFAQFGYSKYNGQSYYQQTPTTGVTIRSDNAYLPDSVKTRMAAAGLTSISIGTSNIDLGPQGSDNTREVYRAVIGADGDFNALGREWKWDTYFQYGVSKTHELLTGAWNLARMTLATDAVVAPAGNAAGIAAGTIVCRSTLTNPTNGCVPLNRIGIGGASQAAIDYVMYNGLQPLRDQELKQKVAAFTLSTNELLSLPAGPVSLAFGGEWRFEGVKGTVDPLYRPIVSNGVTTGTWIYGNYLPTTGSYTVKEGFAETVIPIFEGMDANGAVRVTDYSTSGTVTTWKGGLTWQVIPDIKLRGTISRDIRAPNLSELFAPGTGRTNTVNVPGAGGTVTAYQFNESTVGNPDLAPEVAKTYGAGLVATPTFLPGFAFSADYYKIDLANAISSLDAQTLVNLCYTNGDANACSFISTTGGRGVVTPGLAVTSIEIKPFNFVGVKTEGLDLEASYRLTVGSGNVTLRALASHAFNLYTANGVSAVTDSAGQNTGGLPKWTFRFSAGYDNEAFSVQGIARGVSSGVYNNNYVVCTADCPATSTDYHTINYNHIDGQFFFDLNTSYRFDVGPAKAEAFLAVTNILNSDPTLVAIGPTGNNTPAYPQTNRALYDVLGRVFRFGIRAKM